MNKYEKLMNGNNLQQILIGRHQLFEYHNKPIKNTTKEREEIARIKK
jgi:hypothetical protein